MDYIQQLLRSWLESGEATAEEARAKRGERGRHMGAGLEKLPEALERSGIAGPIMTGFKLAGGERQPYLQEPLTRNVSEGWFGLGEPYQESFEAGTLDPRYIEDVADVAGAIPLSGLAASGARAALTGAMPDLNAVNINPFPFLKHGYEWKLKEVPGSHLGGSTGAKLVESPTSGERFVMKGGASPPHVYEELTADDMYRAMGIDMPETFLGTGLNNEPYKISPFIQGTTFPDLPAGQTQYAKGTMRDQFMADALLANWDVMGGSKWPNILFRQGEASPLRIDTGGSLRYRAQGAPKGAAFSSTDVPEIQSMQKFGNSNMTQQELEDQYRYMIDPHEADIMSAAGLDTSLQDIMQGRLDYLRGEYGSGTAGSLPPTSQLTPAPSKPMLGDAAAHYDQFLNAIQQENPTWSFIDAEGAADIVAANPDFYIADLAKYGIDINLVKQHIAGNNLPSNIGPYPTQQPILHSGANPPPSSPPMSALDEAWEEYNKIVKHFEDPAFPSFAFSNARQLVNHPENFPFTISNQGFDPAKVSAELQLLPQASVKEKNTGFKTPAAPPAANPQSLAQVPFYTGKLDMDKVLGELDAMGWNVQNIMQDPMFQYADANYIKSYYTPQEMMHAQMYNPTLVKAQPGLRDQVLRDIERRGYDRQAIESDPHFGALDPNDLEHAFKEYNKDYYTSNFPHLVSGGQPATPAILPQRAPQRVLVPGGQFDWQKDFERLTDFSMKYNKLQIGNPTDEAIAAELAREWTEDPLKHLSKGKMADVNIRGLSQADPGERLWYTQNKERIARGERPWPHPRKEIASEPGWASSKYGKDPYLPMYVGDDQWNDMMKAVYNAGLDVNPLIQRTLRGANPYPVKKQAQIDILDQLPQDWRTSLTYPPHVPHAVRAGTANWEDLLPRDIHSVSTPEKVAQAQGGGFDVNQMLYKGNAYPLRAWLDPSGKPGSPHQFLADAPHVAGEYMKSGYVYPQVMRPGRTQEHQAGGQRYGSPDQWVENLARESRKQGYETLNIRGINDMGGYQNQILARSPTQLKSPYAEFKKLDDPNMLSGFAGGINPFSGLRPEEEQPLFPWLPTQPAHARRPF